MDLSIGILKRKEMYSDVMQNDKTIIYNNLSGLNHENQINCINEVNDIIGYAYLTSHELKRHELLINNSKMVAEEVTVKQRNMSKINEKFYQQQYRELQKGYMKLLMTSYKK